MADLLEEIRRILERVGPKASPASWAFRFAAGSDGVETVLSGMITIGQLADDIATFRHIRSLDGEESEALGRIARLISKSVTFPCTGCRYFVFGCLMDILIPDYFNIHNGVRRALTKGLQPQKFYYLNRSKGHGRTSDCIGRGRCEADCPQYMGVRGELVEVASLLERM